jgi:hypothetical protein
MFSAQDVQDIFRSLPPQNDGVLPELVPAAAGHGFVTGISVTRHFERLMTDGEPTYFYLGCS